MDQSQSDEKATKDCFMKFANALTDFKIDQINNDGSDNPFDIIKEFRSIAAETSLQLLNTKDSNSAITSKDCELEANLWHLVEALMSFRTSEDFLDDNGVKGIIMTRPYNSSTVFEKELLQNNKGLYQIWIIITWIQGNLPKVERPEYLPSSKWTNTLISGGLKSCDLDYPLRDIAAEIDPTDKTEDHIFYKYIFELLLAGNYEQIFEECKLSDNITLNMIICGIQEYVDPNVDRQVRNEFNIQQGIKKHSLWRRAVYSLSKNDSLDIYERAIYSYLAGDIPNMQVLETLTWDTEILLHLNQILNIEIENYLLEKGKVTKEELILALPSDTMSLQSILNLLSTKHVSESEHPIRVLMGAVILNTLSSVLHSSVSMLMDIVSGNENDNDLFNEPYLLRIVTHISIFLDIISPGSISESDKMNLITAYISILRFHGLYDLIPIYVSFLESENILDSYSFILSTLEGKVVRDKQIQLCNFLKLPIANVLKRTTQRVFFETENEYSPIGDITVTYEITDVDRHLIHAVEWLLEGRLHEDAVDSAIALARRFLINGKVKSLELFIDRNSIDDLLKNFQLENLTNSTFDSTQNVSIKELQQYQYLIDIFKQYSEWEKTVRLLNSESNIPSLIEKFQVYSESTYNLIKTFLVELTEDGKHQDHDVLYEIRALYTPYLIIELHKGLVEASTLLKIPKFIKQALGFTNLVADENDKIYLLFQSGGKLKEYLQLVAHTATLAQ